MSHASGIACPTDGWGIVFQFEKELTKEKDAKAEIKRELEMSEASLSKFKKEFDVVKDSERVRREKEEGVRKLLHEAESKLLLAREMEEKVWPQPQTLSPES